MPETIKEFLVALQWRSDETQQRRFTDAITNAALKANLLGAAIEGAASKIADGVKQSADNITQLAYVSERANTHLEKLRAGEMTAEKHGRMGDEYVRMVDALGEVIKKSRAAQGMLQQMGIRAKEANGQWRDTADIIEDLGPAFKRTSDIMGNQFLVNWQAAFGNINNYPLLQEMMKPDWLTDFADALKRVREFGIGPDTGKQAQEFSRALLNV